MFPIHLISFVNNKCYTDCDSHQLAKGYHTKKWWANQDAGDLYDLTMLLTKPLGNVHFSCRLWHVTNNTLSIPNCRSHGCTDTVKWNHTKREYRKFCSTKCSNTSLQTIAKREETNLRKFGHKSPLSNKDVRQKIQNTCLTTHGTKTPFESNQIQRRIQEAVKSQRGVSSTLLLPEVKEKRKNTMLRKYGTDSFTNRKKYIETMNESYGVDNSFQLESVKEAIMSKHNKLHGTNSHKQHHYTDEAKKVLLCKDNFLEYVEGKSKAEVSFALGVNPTTVGQYSVLHGADSLFANVKSKWENIIAQFLTDSSILFTQNDRTIIPPQELDFYLPDYGVAIELNGLYWHSEIVGNKDKNYHINKWQACKNQNIMLYSYFEDELNTSLSAIKSKIKYVTNKNINVVGARKCEIKSIKKYAEEAEFLNMYHIQGESTARNSSVGAYYEGELVAIMSWLVRKNYLEITRYCCDCKNSYPGLFSKMLKNIISNLSYEGTVVSFSNNAHSNGNVYKSSGFLKTQEYGPAYWYTRDYTCRENRQNYMKDKIAKKFGVDIKNKTEWQLMKELKYDRVWDCGKIKWSKIV